MSSVALKIKAFPSWHPREIIQRDKGHPVKRLFRVITLLKPGYNEKAAGEGGERMGFEALVASRRPRSPFILQTSQMEQQEENWQRGEDERNIEEGGLKRTDTYKVEAEGEALTHGDAKWQTGRTEAVNETAGAEEKKAEWRAVACE